PTCADAPRLTIYGPAHALHVDEHVRTSMLDRLKAPDRTTELHAVLRVLDRHVEYTPRTAEHLGRREHGAPVQQRVDGVGVTHPCRGRAVEVQPPELARAVDRGLGRGSAHRV